MTRIALAVSLACATGLASPLAMAGKEADVQLVQRDRFVTEGGAAGDGGAEIVAYDKATKRLFVMNAGPATVDVLSVGADGSLEYLDTIDASSLGGGANSVDASGGIVAVAVQAEVKTDPGLVVFYDAATLAKLGQVTVGALPDMVTFTPNGRFALVANEGEPNADYSVDPEGSVSVIDLTAGPAGATVRTVRLDTVALPPGSVCMGGVRLFGANNPTLAQDLEPEYITTDGSTAWVTLQENNAVATIQVRTARLLSIRGLGCKDHSLPGAGIDASDRDVDGSSASGGKINIANWPVKGVFMPDAIDMIRFQGDAFLLTANEGDSRVYPDPCGGTGQPACVLNEEIRVGSGSYLLDPVKFPDAANLKLPINLGRLTVTSRSGDTDGDGDFDEIHAFGARSFSIFNAATGELVFDSGDEFEQLTKLAVPTRFNSNGGADTFDTRSDNKGPEPEAVKIGRAYGRSYAFIASERTGGLFTYQIDNPYDPRLVSYLPFPEDGDRAPEGLEYVTAADSPTGRPLLFVGSEVSGSATLYEVLRANATP
jgi:3-phytase